MNDLATSAMQSPIVTREDQLRALAQVFGQEYADDFQDPVVFRQYEFFSPAVKQFYKREFPLISRTLFVESVYRRRPTYNQEVLDAFSAMAAKKLADILHMITTQCDRLEKLCKSNGQPTDAAYLHPQPTLVPVIAAHANSYIRCLAKLDELYQLTGSATLNGVIDGNQRKAFELLCRKAVRAFSAMLRNEIIKLRKESYRMKAATGVVDTEVDKAEGAQEAAIATFDRGVQEEARMDSSVVVDPGAAAGVIDDLTAAAAAVAKPKRAATREPAAETAAAGGAAAS
jgi:hypothetical protein